MNKFPSPSFINVDGWEIHINEGTLAIPRDCPKETRSNARNYIKGLKKLWTASKTKGFFEAAGEKVHGNTNTQETKYQKLCQTATSDMIRRIGEGFGFSIESYVDGSYSICVKSNK
jgi:hypothetical protein